VARLEGCRPGWITNISTWCGRDGLALRDVRAVPGADIAIGRLEPVPADMVASLPVLKNPAVGIDPGRSLCRLGYAFTKVKATFDESVAAFRVEGEVPYFPLEGCSPGSSTPGRPPTAVRPLHRDPSPGLGPSGGVL
jgi:hypothetical protein